MEEIYDLRETINNKNPLIRMFFKWKFRKAIEFADLKENEIALDFGCGGKYIKTLFENQIICYDKNKESTEIEDYKKVKPNVIFCIDVLEHIDKEELNETINNFKQTNARLILIISNETILWKLLRKMLSLPTKDDHITNLDEVLKIIKKEFLIVRKFSFLSLSHLYEFRLIKQKE